MAEVPVGPTIMDIVESMLQPGAQQTARVDPTTLFLVGGTATDIDGYYFPTGSPTASPLAAPLSSPSASPSLSPSEASSAAPTVSLTKTPTS